ncbi:hypothetical protein OL239_02025 [Arthrobacter sp. ATA002]|uniref:hypothetical protein n=1 Tax=Arthrobacter sp. ATA002 TaxID=2991715 RepID=UPI0022A7B9E9|nr:hypothetical protein [Arthrobacter sp. ATA002]WAP52119.1 hypothetical protein OL239_02025 [Arthrobacter sp. ATA002]
MSDISGGMMMAASGVGLIFVLLYFLVIAAVAVLVVWALVLAIMFLRLRIAEMRAAAGPAGGSEMGP